MKKTCYTNTVKKLGLLCNNLMSKGGYHMTSPLRFKVTYKWTITLQQDLSTSPLPPIHLETRNYYKIHSKQEANQMSNAQPKEALKAFIKACEFTSKHRNLYSTSDSQRDPNTEYTFDSDRDSSISEICRQNGRANNECITVSDYRYCGLDISKKSI